MLTYHHETARKMTEGGFFKSIYLFIQMEILLLLKSKWIATLEKCIFGLYSLWEDSDQPIHLGSLISLFRVQRQRTTMA